MKKFLANYPVEGTSALQMKPEAPSARPARIISFPEVKDGEASQIAAAATFGASKHASARIGHLVREADFASALRTGTALGQPYGRMTTLQAVVGGCILAALAFLSLLIGL